MRMQVVDLLAPTRPRIDDRTKPRVAAGVGATELFGQPRHQNHHFTKHRRVSFGAIGQRFHVYSRNHEHMGVGGWMNIKQLTSGEVAYYIDEYDTNGNWISGQYKTGVNQLGINATNFQYTPSSTNVKKASLQIILVGNSGIVGYFDEPQWTPTQ